MFFTSRLFKLSPDVFGLVSSGNNKTSLMRTFLYDFILIFYLFYFCMYRCPASGRCGQIRHPGVNWLSQKKGWGGQEGHAGQQVCPEGPQSALLPHVEQPNPHGSPGPGGVEISFISSCACLHSCHVCMNNSY